MPPKIDDRWLWLGFGIFIFFAAKGIRYAINDTVRLTRLDPLQHEPKKKQKEHRPEDAISLENLKILAEHPNPNIANAAISLIVSRFDELPNKTQLLTEDLNSEDEDVRFRAKCTVDLLNSFGAPQRLMPPHPMMTPPDSSNVTPTSESTQLTTAELSRRLADDAGGEGWAEGMVIPSPQNPVAGWTNIPRERPVDHDAEEFERRRRRREAMVLHEGSGQVVEGDIIRPRG